MAATTTLSTSSIAKQLSRLHPTLTFKVADTFSWQPATQSVLYQPKGPVEALLHETGHALSAHEEFARDIELIALERDAWTRARVLADTLEISLDETIVSDHLDTYRDWLHDRSTCVNCSETGIETSKHHYRCLICESEWRVNDARTCRLKRLRINPTKNLS